MKIGDIFAKENYTEHAIWANENNAMIIVLDDGNFQLVEIPKPLPPTKEEVSEKRRQLYIAEKDPITCQIQALRDEEQTEEIMEQIESLKEERARVVEKIKAENPYPQEAEAKNETGNI